MGFIDTFAPPTLRQAAISIQLELPEAIRRPLAPIGFLVAVDASLAPAGLVLPLEQIITGPGGKIVRATRHRLSVPSRITFTPEEGGSYLLLLREEQHDHHYGTVVFSVLG